MAQVENREDVDGGAHPAPSDRVRDGAESPVFVSYAREDTSRAQRIRELLERAGVDTWVDIDGLYAGEECAARVLLATASAPKAAVQQPSRPAVLRDDRGRRTRAASCLRLRPKGGTGCS